MEEFYKPGRPVWRKRNAEHRPEAHRKYVSSLIKTLEELEEKTRPSGGAETELGKDLAAFQALKFARYLVDAVAGWALDHQIGLALSRLEFPGSDAFMVAYRTALAGTASEIKPTSRASKGTFNHLALEYFTSPDFLRLRPHTRHVYRLVIERFLAEHGHRLVREMARDDVKRIVASKADTPGAANDLLKKIRVLINFAIESGIRTDEPTIRIRMFPEGAIHTWTEDEIAQFEARWPQGTRVRTAFAFTRANGALMWCGWPGLI
jgi:hypothetical protein